jgi:hypothetical protein
MMTMQEILTGRAAAGLHHCDDMRATMDEALVTGRARIAQHRANLYAVDVDELIETTRRIWRETEPEAY